jgi:hypothetical protein
MFSPAVGRVARSSTSFSAAPASCFVRNALSTCPAPQQPFRPGHQRRYSSSKPSTPPIPNSKKKPELDQNATAELQGAEKKAKGSKKLKEPSTAITGNSVPFVPPTNHLREDGTTWGMTMYILTLTYSRRQTISLFRPPPPHLHLALVAERDVNRRIRCLL